VSGRAILRRSDHGIPNFACGRFYFTIGGVRLVANAQNIADAFVDVDQE
jgi:hypothetical protein